MPLVRHVLINGLSIGSAGGYTVGRELLRHLAAARPDWQFTLALVSGYELHEPMRDEALPANGGLLWAPPATIGRWARRRYESRDVVPWAEGNRIDAVVQLNGMVIPEMRVPTLAHQQDPWPYRPEAWSSPADRFVALVKRRAHRAALRRAAYVGFTSTYLRDLICGFHQIRPSRAAVFYNGVPDDWVERAAAGAGDTPPWETRPMELVSVSNVNSFKRQDLVIRALPALVRRSGLESLIYRVIGHGPASYIKRLQQLATGLGVGDRVVFEGRVPDDRVRDALGRAKAFVLMSVCESFGIPAVEAMSFGAPVVTADCCAMPEVCGAAADLCPPDDLDALVGRLSRVLSDPAHAADLRRRGFERVSRFRWTQTAAHMADALEAVMRARPAEVAVA
jgi:glycosyltransferase involved in cell wall biosynthesis